MLAEKVQVDEVVRIGFENELAGESPRWVTWCGVPGTTTRGEHVSTGYTVPGWTTTSGSKCN